MSDPCSLRAGLTQQESRITNLQSNRILREAILDWNVADPWAMSAVPDFITGAEGDFAGETRRRNLRRIPQAKSEHVRRTWIPTTSLVTARSALSLGLVMGNPALSNKRLRCKARTLRLQEIR